MPATAAVGIEPQTADSGPHNWHAASSQSPQPSGTAARPSQPPLSLYLSAQTWQKASVNTSLLELGKSSLSGAGASAVAGAGAGAGARYHHRS